VAADTSIYMQRIFELMGQLDWSAERLADERQAALRSLVTHAVQGSRFYARRLAHLDPARLTEADLGSLPPLDKAELMQHWDEIVTAPGLSLARCEAHLSAVAEGDLQLAGHRIFASGGSTGLRAVVAYDDEEWTLFGAGMRRWMLRSLLRGGVAFSERPVIAQVQAAALTHMSGMIGSDLSQIAMHPFPATLPLAEIVKGLNDLQPESLAAYASILRMLAEEALSGRLCIHPSSLVSSGEPLSAEDEEIVCQAWDVPLFDAYGSSETGILAVGDGSTPGLYLNEDLVIVEPVDIDGQPVAPGDRSAKLYVTPLHHRTLPLLRYELTDEVTLLPEPCPHGSSFGRIARVEGRLDDCFTYRGGVRVHPIVFRSPLTRHRSITAYQVRQSERGATISLEAGSAVDCDVLAREIESGLAGVGLTEPRVSIERVPSIKRTHHGAKLRRFVPLS
jgi:phenylacetate-coenzyme A ligase PaaK-like adenylate-forming protein